MNVPAVHGAASGEQDQVRVEQQSIDVQRFSTCYTIGGSVFALGLLVMFGVTGFNRWQNREPSINDILHATTVK